MLTALTGNKVASLNRLVVVGLLIFVSTDKCVDLILQLQPISQVSYFP